MKKPTKNRPSFSSHGTFKFTILFGALVTIDHTLSLPLLFSTKNKPKETNYAAKKETHKINLLFKFTLKNVTGIDEENLTKCIDCVIYLQSSLSSSRLAWRAFIWLAFHFNFSFCAFSLKKNSSMVYKIHIGHWHSTSNMHQWIVHHYPYTETSKWSYTLFCTALRVFVCFFSSSSCEYSFIFVFQT